MQIFGKHILLRLFFILSVVFSTNAQNAFNIHLEVTPKVEIKSKEWETVVVEMENVGSEDFDGILTVDVPSGMDVIGSAKIPIRIAANKKRYQPIRLRVNQLQKAGTVSVGFTLKTQENPIAETSTSVFIPTYHRVRIFTEEPTVFMKNIGDSIRIDFQIVNLGNQDEILELVVNLPQELEYRKRTPTQIKLPAFTDTIVTYSRLIDRKMLQLEQFSIRVALLNKHMEFMANTLFFVQNTASQRRYKSPADLNTQNRSWTKNQISFGIRDIGQNSQSYTAQGRGEFLLDKSQVNFNVDAIWWDRPQVKPMMTNTWVAYENEHMGVRAGNIQDHETNMYINGRGVTFNYKDAFNTQSDFHLGVIDKTYNLLDPVDHTSIEEFNVFAKFKNIKTKNSNQNLFYVFDKSFEGYTNLLQNSIQWTPNESWRLNIAAGGANTYYMLNALNTTKFSGALDVNYIGQIGGFQVKGNNTWSSAYYPGIRRGVLSFNNGISKQKDQYKFWLNGSYLKNNPKYISFHAATNERESYGANAGVSSVLGANFRYSLSPEYFREKGAFFTVIDESSTTLSMENVYVHTTLSWYSRKSGQSLVATLSNGISNLSYSKGPTFINRTNLAWNYNGFNLNASYQNGGFYLSESAYNYLYDNQSSIERWTMASGYYRMMFNNNLQGNAQIIYQADRFFGNTWSYNLQSNLNVSNFLEFYFGLQGSYYEKAQHFSPKFLMRAGVNLKLPNGRQAVLSRSGNINVFVYYDNNNNNQFDEGIDFPAKNELVAINKVNFITDDQGKVGYNKVPHGQYKIEARVSKWYSEEQVVAIDSKRTQVAIPLQRTGTLRGKIDVQEIGIMNEQVTGSLARIHIVLTDPNGKKWTAMTNDSGDFSIYLPTNTYNVHIPKEHLPNKTSLKDIPNTVEIVQSKITILDTLYLHVEKRNIEIKRFGQ